MKIKQWILIFVFVGILPFVFANLPWPYFRWKLIILFIVLGFGIFRMIFNTIKSRNKLVIVINAAFSIIMLICMFLILQRYFN